MKVVDAHEDTSAVVRATISVQMAEALIAENTDLASEAAVKATLMVAGFGRPSIDALWQRAIRTAQGKPPAHFS